MDKPIQLADREPTPWPGMRTTNDGRKRLRFDFRTADTHPETECEYSYDLNKLDLRRGFYSVPLRRANPAAPYRLRYNHPAVLILLLIPFLLNFCLVERSQVANPAAHKFLDDIIHDNATGIAFSGHFEDMPISAIRAAQNFHRTEFLDNVEKAKTYAARAAESRKLADKAFEAMMKTIALLDPTDLSEEERIVRSKYREVNLIYDRIQAAKQPDVPPAQPEVVVQISEEVVMAPPDLD